MIICVCKAVSDRQIKSAVADGATSMRDLTRKFALGTCCGKCVPHAKETLCAALHARESVPSFFAAPATEYAT